MGCLTLTAMDASGYRCRAAPEPPDPHFRSTPRIPPICRWPRSFRRGAGLAAGVTSGEPDSAGRVTVLSITVGEQEPPPERRKQADMTELGAASRVVVGGIDTHKDVHVAAVLDTAAVLLGTQ